MSYMLRAQGKQYQDQTWIKDKSCTKKIWLQQINKLNEYESTIKVTRKSFDIFISY